MNKFKVIPPRTADIPQINLYDRRNPVTVKVISNDRLTDPNAESDIRHIVLDFGNREFPVLEGQNIGIIPPGKNKRGRAHPARLYSIASARDGEWRNTNTIALTVKRITYENNGEIVKGLASNFICDAEKGCGINVTGPFGDTFLMPTHAEANIIMICVGTGAAPFRSMTEYHRRHMKNTVGKLKLYFGARTPGELPYFKELSKLSENLINKQLVYSRAHNRPRKYVQHHMISETEELAELLKSKETYVYICGLHDMKVGAEEAFDEICGSHDMDWDEVKSAMIKTGRYHVETY